MGSVEQIRKYHVTVLSCPTDKTTPFFFTPTSLLLKHSLITDKQQIAGSNGQQWINCTRGSSWTDGGGVRIINAKNSELISRNSMTATIGPERNLRNGLYYCSDGQAPRYYISLFLKNSSKCMIYCTYLKHYIKTRLNLAYQVKEIETDK